MIAYSAEDPETSFDQIQTNHVDVTGAKSIEVIVRQDGTVLWVNINGVCAMRVCQAEKIVVRDESRAVQVLLNTCSHRGNALCRAEMGNAPPQLTNGEPTAAQIAAATKHPSVQRMLNAPGNTHSAEKIAKQFIIEAAKNGLSIGV